MPCIENAFWLNEITQWEKTNADAQEKLEGIKTLLSQQTLALEEHKQSIQSHEAIAKEHEHVLIEVADAKDEAIKPIHPEEKKAHQQQAAFHADIKIYHRKTLALINTLHKEAQLFEKDSF